MKRRYNIGLAVLAVIAAGFGIRALIGNSTVATFTPEGPIAGQEAHLIITMVLLMLIVVVPMFIALFTIAWKYRAGNRKARKEYDPELRHGPWAELILWAIPAALVAVLGTFAFRAAHAVDPYQPIAGQSLTIEVVALPWKWLFIYPQQNIATVNLVEFPAGTPVHFELTADAPMSSFWIPQLGSQIYAMAAMETQLNLLASTTGEYTGRDTEINGAGYAGMTFKALSVTPADFAAWVAGVKGTSTYPALTEDSYNALAAPSQDNPVAYYSSVDENLFSNIMMKFMMPMGTEAGATGTMQMNSTDSMQMMPGMQM
jgi:cytochrome o ubiquinol oxidase subunit 2